MIQHFTLVLLRVELKLKSIQPVCGHSIQSFQLFIVCCFQTLFCKCSVHEPFNDLEIGNSGKHRIY